MNEATSEITKEMHIPPNRWLKRMTGMNRADAGKTESAGSGLTEKLPVFPYEDLAEKLLGYGAVCFVAQRCLEEFSRKFRLSLRNGDFLILRHGSPAERFSYGQYEKQMEDFARKRKQELRQMLLRSCLFVRGHPVLLCCQSSQHSRKTRKRPSPWKNAAASYSRKTRN